MTRTLSKVMYMNVASYFEIEFCVASACAYQVAELHPFTHQGSRSDKNTNNICVVCAARVQISCSFCVHAGRRAQSARPATSLVNQMANLGHEEQEITRYNHKCAHMCIHKQTYCTPARPHARERKSNSQV